MNDDKPCKTCGAPLISDLKRYCKKCAAKRNKEACTVYRKKQAQKPKKPMSVKARYNMYTKRAASKGIAFAFSLKMFELATSMKCYYCNTPNAGGLDRINSAGGYTKDNTVPCCRVCNMMKYTNGPKVFIEHIHKIHSHITTSSFVLPIGKVD